MLFYSTPIGALSYSEVKNIASLKVWKVLYDSRSVALLSEEIGIEKEVVVEKSNKSKMVFKKMKIPIRYYNLCFFLKESKDNLKEAISLFKEYDNAYLPSIKGFSSYNEMIK